MRKQCEKLSVEFPQKNESIYEKLKTDWLPVGVELKADSKKCSAPDLSTWNMSCLVLSERAKDVLSTYLSDYGELLPLENDYFLFNCLRSIGSDAIDQTQTSFKIESEDSIHIPNELVSLPDSIKGALLFKPEFSHNSFLICQDEFKNLVVESELGGLLFEQDLAQIFPSRK